MNRKTTARAAIAASAILAAAGAQAGSFWEAVIDTTPAGLVRNSADRPGDWQTFWSDSKEGAQQIFDEGRTMWVVPTYTNHPRWDWENRSEENAWPFGGGLGRMMIDDRGNERLLFAVAFVDSNYSVQPMVGYSWVARWPVGNTGLHVGAGYLAGITMRADYLWLPCPLPLPVAKVGTDDVSFYGTWIPGTNVFFFYSAITLDDTKGRKMPLPADSPWAKHSNLLYGSWGLEYTDNGTEECSPSNVRSGHVWNAGLRHYSGRSWQTDFKYSRSEHDVRRVDNSGEQRVDYEHYMLTVAYNIDATRSLRLFGGAGVGYGRAESRHHSDSSVFPTITMGFTWAATDRLHLTGSMDTSFPRYSGVVDDRDDHYVLKTMPTAFTLGLGLAF